MLELEEDNGSGTTGGGGTSRKAVFRRGDVSVVCDACQQAPAAYLCKADAASLCTTCDLNIHSANSLARRHHRVPILPVSGNLYGPPAHHHHHHLFIGNSIEDMTEEEEDSFLTQEIDEDEAASWLLQENNNNYNNNYNNNGIHFNEEVVDEYLNLNEYTSSCQENEQLLFIEKCNNNTNNYNNQEIKKDGFIYGQQKRGFEGDGVVPAATSFFNEGKEQQMVFLKSQQGFNLGLQFGASVSYPVSSSCMDIVVVPQSTSSDISYSHPTTPKGSIDFFSTSSSTQMMPHQLTPLDREARVLRYREKKKTRKFEKTIRYASRKAYAEIRPRVKGRFAKRTNAEFSQVGYGIVPSF